MKELLEMLPKVAHETPLTKNGGVNNAVIGDLKPQVVDSIVEKFDNVVIANNGSILIPVAKTGQDDVLYAKLDVSITAKTEFAVKGAKAKTSKTTISL